MSRARTPRAGARPATIAIAPEPALRGHATPRFGIHVMGTPGRRRSVRLRLLALPRIDHQAVGARSRDCKRLGDVVHLNERAFIANIEREQISERLDVLGTR